MPNPCVGMKVKDNGFEHKKRRVKSAREKHHGLISFAVAIMVAVMWSSSLVGYGSCVIMNFTSLSSRDFEFRR